MYFTVEDYRKIEKWLRENSIKDTEFPETSDLSLDEQLPIIQDNKNKKTSLKNLVDFLAKTDSELDIESNNPIENQAVARAIYELQSRKNYIKISYNELVTLRDNSELIPGNLYQIIDYTTTTIQDSTQSAGHPFDVIVLALSESELSEKAWACHSERDTDEHFANSKLQAWQLWYCLDNDTNRFGWIDTENGKGVIYRMIDEWNNDCPYDFKNILLKDIGDDSDGKYYYTFALEVIEDYSLYGMYCNSNVIKANNPYLTAKQYINRCIFQNASGASCKGNFLEENCMNNKFKSNCSNNRLLPNSIANYFGNGCSQNVLRVASCIFGNNCYCNVADGMSGSTLGNSCYRNRFGCECANIVLENNCTNNTFGNSCTNITISTFSRNIVFESFVDRITIFNNETASKNYQIQNVVVKSWINTTGGREKVIISRGNEHELIVAKDSEGGYREFCLADFVTKIK